MAYTNELVAECLQNEQAFCTAECPFGLDIRDFIGKLQQGRFNVAYKNYQNTVGFPGIVSTLCPEPCKQVCALKDSGGSISLRMLEKASMDFARNTEPDQFNMPAKEKTIAIIGGGISGLACALRLSTKKYRLSLFEKTDHTGGHLCNLSGSEEFMADIEKQFRYEEYQLHLNTEIHNLDDLKYDAVYIATGSGGEDFGLTHPAGNSFATDREGVFMGGSVTGADTINAIAHGLNVSAAIETYLKTGSMSHRHPGKGTKLTYDAINIIPSGQVLPSAGPSYTKEEATNEAKRCLRCTCDACVRHSPLMDYFKKFPRRITEEVEVTINPSTLDGNGTVATRLIASCDHCGLCREVCPKNIDTGEFLLASHRAMHEKGAMPWAFHEFFLRDMEFSNGEAALVKPAPGYDKSRFMFFPGCQLGASDPRYVTESYRLLLSHQPQTALMLGCCGAPAEWAGDVPLHNEVIDMIREHWISLGRPGAILACPTCRQMFRKYLPEIECHFIYEFVNEIDIKGIKMPEEVSASVFDPCASREEPALQQTIRKFSTSAGFNLKPLPLEGRLAECCSYGGHVSITHPPYAAHSMEKKINRNDLPYITYCSNCRDIFASAGKKTWHILDIILGIDNVNRHLPTVSERRDNRLLLKDHILREFWNEQPEMGKEHIKLYIEAQLKEKLNRAKILESDLRDVIIHCEETGEKMLDPEKNTFIGHRQIGNTTYWAEYSVKGRNEYELINGYCHRMKIEEA